MNDELPYDLLKSRHNQHESDILIRENIHSGKFKKYENLENRRCGNGFGEIFYLPNCFQESFHIDNRNGKLLLQGCPGNCMSYQPIWKAKFIKVGVTMWRFCKYQASSLIKGVLKWFASLSWPIQVIISIFAAIIFLPHSGSNKLIDFVLGLLGH